VALAIVEPILKYQPDHLEVLTQVPNRDRGHCVVGSLTGAVSSQRVTEEYEGTLSMVGNHAVSIMV
jgi:REP element-mobilizing transposase RayT